MKLSKFRKLLFISLFFLIFITGINLKSTFNKSTLNPAAKRPPNILFILTDDLDNASVAYMPQVKSLLIDRGVSFNNYFVNVSVCCPSRATTLRGQYAHNTGVLNNDFIEGSFVVFHQRGKEQSTIATWLQEKGYRTALFGKYLNGYPYRVPKNYVPPGWDEWNSPVRGSAYSQYNYTLNENGKLVSYGDRPQDYGTDVYTDKAKQFIIQAAKANQPFFVYLAYYTPHQPATPAPRHQNLFPDARAPRTPAYNEADVSDKPQYIRELPFLDKQQQTHIDRLYQKRLRSLQAVDESLLSLYNTLKTTNQLDNTYIFFTSDNGFHLGQHRLPPGKETAYEEDIHVPLFVRGPDVPTGKVIREIVGNVDLAPTFAELAGANIPDFVDGRSFVQLLRHQLSSSDSWRKVFLLEHWSNPKETPIVPEYSGLRISSCTYVEYNTGEQELYDLKQDPDQLQNIAKTTKPDVIKQYARRLAQLRRCSGKSCRRSDAQPLSSCAG